MKFNLCQMMSRYFGLSLNIGVSSVLKQGVLPERQNSFYSVNYLVITIFPVLVYEATFKE